MEKLGQKEDIVDLAGCQLLLVAQLPQGGDDGVLGRTWVGLCLVESPDGLMLPGRAFKGSLLQHMFRSDRII
jgi:hypothetical protein